MRKEGRQGRAEAIGDVQMMKRLRWSGREGEMDGIKVGMEMTAEMITCINCGGKRGSEEKDEWRCGEFKLDCGERLTEL